MINQSQIQKLVKNYDPKNITIGVLGGHSGLDVCRGAKNTVLKLLLFVRKAERKPILNTTSPVIPRDAWTKQ